MNKTFNPKTGAWVPDPDYESTRDAEFTKVREGVTKLLWELGPITLKPDFLREAAALGVWNYIKGQEHCIFCDAIIKPGEEHVVCNAKV